MKLLSLQFVLFFSLCFPLTYAIADTSLVIDEDQLQQLQDMMLNDPSFLQAVSSRDVGKLERDSRFTKLMGNQKIRQIIDRMK
jgi:hypothetical protein